MYLREAELCPCSGQKVSLTSVGGDTTDSISVAMSRLIARLAAMAERKLLVAWVREARRLIHGVWWEVV